MKTSKKTTSILILFFLVTLGYWTYLANQYEKELAELSQPFINACKSKDGCITNPEGWRDNGDNTYYKDRMTYKATQEEFTIKWHIATDVYLVANGGKNKKLAIEHVSE